MGKVQGDPSTVSCYKPLKDRDVCLLLLLLYSRVTGQCSAPRMWGNPCQCLGVLVSPTLQALYAKLYPQPPGLFLIVFSVAWGHQHAAAAAATNDGDAS